MSLTLRSGVFKTCGLLAAVLVASVTAGCAPAAPPASSGSPGAESIKIGVALPEGSQMYWASYKNGAEAKAKELGVEITVTDAKNDANTMNEQISTMIVSGVAGISIASVDPDANLQSAQAATEAGIPLITGNRLLSGTYGGVGGANPQVHVGFNDVIMGEQQGQLLIQACEGKDPCLVVLQEATLGSSPQIQRTEGLTKAIEGQSNIQIIDKQTNNFDPAKAVEVTQTILQAHDKIDVMVTQDDYTAVAAQNVLSEQKRDGILVIGLGGSVNGIEAVQKGLLYGTVFHSASEDAAKAVETLVQIIRGQGDQVTVATGGERPTVVVETSIVTKENASQFEGTW
ncbi:MAG: sugar ABC transporter substrate-binding protein [Actinobacteria bacterium]|nr:sugar ABC transporter substrate-binding protein [Actinomycetota bacterium]